MHSKKSTLTAVLFFCLIIQGCQQEDTMEFSYPLVMTLAADHITSDGARLNARITVGNAEDITEYGFVWDNTTLLNVTDSKKALATGNPAVSFSMEITYTPDPFQKIYCRSYIRSGELILYGNMVSFSTP